MVKGEMGRLVVGHGEECEDRGTGDLEKEESVHCPLVFVRAGGFWEA